MTGTKTPQRPRRLLRCTVAIPGCMGVAVYADKCRCTCGGRTEQEEWEMLRRIVAEEVAAHLQRAEETRNRLAESK